jgi:methionine-S-sulfoxide reductase
MRKIAIAAGFALIVLVTACSRAESKEGASAAAGRAAAGSVPDRPVKTEVAYFAGGCFWGIQHYFKKGPGVLEAVSGYMQGDAPSPTYEDVCSDRTGHAETVMVVFDPGRISYRRLLEAFFVMHDPTQAGGQGPDVGSQYRSGIWAVGDAQRREAEAYVRELEASGRYGGRKIVTLIEPAKTFWRAEEYHQDYIEKHGAFCRVRNPW